MSKDELTKKQKKVFTDLLEANLQPYGFKKMTREFGGKVKYSRCIRFERMRGENLGDWIECTFDKYGTPRFNVTFAVNHFAEQETILRLGSLVKKPGRAYAEWGANRLSLFRKRAWLKGTHEIERFLPQIIEFLETGKAGKNICLRLENEIPKGG